MTNYFVLGSMGAGKTLTATFLAYLYSLTSNENKIYANYRLKNINNFVYTKHGFVTFSEFSNCLMIMDDIVSVMSTLTGFSKMLVLSSRKTNVEIIFTSQYYTDLPRKNRSLCLTIIPQFDKENMVCQFKVSKFPLVDDNSFFNPNNYHEPIYFNPLPIFNLYDTKERTSLATEEDIYHEILNLSKTPEDLRNNVSLWKDKASAQNVQFKRMKKEGIDYNSDLVS